MPSGKYTVPEDADPPSEKSVLDIPAEPASAKVIAVFPADPYPICVIVTTAPDATAVKLACALIDAARLAAVTLFDVCGIQV